MCGRVTVREFSNITGHFCQVEQLKSPWGSVNLNGPRRIGCIHQQVADRAMGLLRSEEMPSAIKQQHK